MRAGAVPPGCGSLKGTAQFRHLLLLVLDGLLQQMQRLSQRLVQIGETSLFDLQVKESSIFICKLYVVGYHHPYSRTG